MTEQIDVTTLDEATLALRDPLELQRLFNDLVAKQAASLDDPENAPELSPAECRFAITLTRILRRTNTGPAKAKGKKKEPKKKTTQADIDAMFE
jgi:hypothetical protein